MSVTINNICAYISPGNVYVGAQVPAPLHSLGEEAHLSADGVPSGGTHVGATTGEAVYRYSATVETVDIEQSTFGVCPHVTAEEATLEFTVAEATAENIKRAIGQGFLRDFTGPDSLTGKVISVGGLTDVTGTSICVISEKKNDPGRYCGAMIYNAYNDAGLERRFKKGEATFITMTFRGIASTATLDRPAGDQLGQYFEQNA